MPVFLSPGPYSEPYLFVNTRFEIQAIDLLTHRTGIFRGVTDSNAIAIDTVEMKLYFDDNDNIFRAGVSGTGVEVVMKDANVNKMTIDWIGRRIFWIGSRINQIFVANLDGQEKRVLTNTNTSSQSIAVDPTSG